MEKIKKIKKLLTINNLDGYFISKNDEFFNEYVPDNKDRLKSITRFTGSYGFALITIDQNYLFVDGRYTLQAQMQSGKDFKIITIPKKLPSNILGTRKLKIGFNPRLHTKKSLKILFNKSKCQLISINEKFIDKYLINNKKINLNNFYVLPKKAYGQSYKTKTSKLIKILKKIKADMQFISSGENIAWLLNMRGKDSEFSPTINCYLIIDIKRKKNLLFCNLKKVNKSIKTKLKYVEFRHISLIDEYFSSLQNKKILVDEISCSAHFENLLKKKNNVIKFNDPIYQLKSIKTKAEINNIVKAHIIDGVALTKFLFWVKQFYKNRNISEIGAQKKLLEFRKKSKSFKFSSFPTISGSGPNGAIIHYKANKKSNRKLKKGDIYLVDSGGQYNFGTTDVTRTISLDNKNQRIKNIFTRVLIGHLTVANYKLTKNTSGQELDKVARKPLNKINLDYAHSTGHGVGYFLNVHEGPHAIAKNNKCNFQEGIVISNEPGYYEKGSFGIRIENLITVKKEKKNLKFFNLTMAPIDKSLINKKIMNKKELRWFNDYHKIVYKNLKKFMNKTELLKLKEACSEL